jgi:hypothetical protein
MSTNGAAVLERVKQVWADADAAGEKRPGRGRLATLLDVKEHHVQKALIELKQQAPSADAADTTPDEPATSTPSDRPSVRFIDRARSRPWALILMGVAAGFSVWSGWVGLGEMTGFGPVQPLPGIWDRLTINSAIVLPISVEAYGAYALRVWLTPGRSRRTSIYAGASAIASLTVGGAAQVAYHLLKAFGHSRAPWQVVMSVALVPVVVLALASILAKLVSTDHQAGSQQ